MRTKGKHFKLESILWLFFFEFPEQWMSSSIMRKAEYWELNRKTNKFSLFMTFVNVSNFISSVAVHCINNINSFAFPRNHYKRSHTFFLSFSTNCASVLKSFNQTACVAPFWNGNIFRALRRSNDKCRKETEQSSWNLNSVEYFVRKTEMQLDAQNKYGCDALF